MSRLRTEMLLEPAALEDLLGSEQLLLLDLRSPESYQAGHIPGAIHADYGEFVHRAPPAMGLLPPMPHLSAVLSALGLRPEHHVVVYDEEGGGRAARVLWTLDVLGHRHCSLLNGGAPAWRRQGLSWSREATRARPSNYLARLDRPQALADRHYILERLDSADLVLLDTRSPAEYRGEDVRAARGGHIPGAVNMDWTDNMDMEHDRRLRDPSELAARLEALGVTPDREVVVYCQTHHRSALSYFVLRLLGYPRVRGYPGAWSEWGNDPSLPVSGS